MTDFPRIVTISATYGAGATRIGPAVADRLGLPFLDRMVTPEMAGRATSAPDVTEDEQEEGLFRRIVDALASLPALFGTTMPQPEEELSDDVRVQRGVEAELCEVASTSGGVMFGRGATQLLHGRPNTYHVRLDGPADARAEQAAAQLGITVDEAVRQRDATDRVRTHYVRRLYGVEPGDSRLYHLVLDTTAVDFPTATDVIVSLAQSFWSAATISA